MSLIAEQKSGGFLIIKKIMRDKDMKVDEEIKKEISKEMGDVLWYLAQLATELGLSLDDIAVLNIEKLFVI